MYFRIRPALYLTVNTKPVYFGKRILAIACAGICSNLYVFGATAPQWARAYSFRRFLDHTQRRTTVGKTLLDE